MYVCVQIYLPPYLNTYVLHFLAYVELCGFPLQSMEQHCSERLQLSLQAAVLFIPIKPVHQIGAILTWSRIFLSVKHHPSGGRQTEKSVFHKSWPRLCLNMKWRNHRIYRILDIATKYYADLQSMYQNHVAICAYLCAFHPFPPHSEHSQAIPGLSLQLSHDAKGRCSWPPALPQLQAMLLPSEPQGIMDGVWHTECNLFLVKLCNIEDGLY